MKFGSSSLSLFLKPANLTKLFEPGGLQPMFNLFSSMLLPQMRNLYDL